MAHLDVVKLGDQFMVFCFQGVCIKYGHNLEYYRGSHFEGKQIGSIVRLQEWNIEAICLIRRDLIKKMLVL